LKALNANNLETCTVKDTRTKEGDRKREREREKKGELDPFGLSINLQLLKVH